MSHDPASIDNALCGPLLGGSHEPTFAGAPSFMRRRFSKDFGQADVVVWGVPFDCATSNRPGARFGPAAIRRASLRVPPTPGSASVPAAGQRWVAIALHGEASVGKLGSAGGTSGSFQLDVGTLESSAAFDTLGTALDAGGYPRNVPNRAPTAAAPARRSAPMARAAAVRPIARAAFATRAPARPARATTRSRMARRPTSTAAAACRCLRGATRGGTWAWMGAATPASRGAGRGGGRRWRRRTPAG